MHRGVDRRCLAGHPRHAGRGLCHSCRARIRRGVPVDIGPVQDARLRPDEVLDEWEFLAGEVRFVDFPARVGITLRTWERIFSQAAKAGDPRAIRPRERAA